MNAHRAFTALGSQPCIDLGRLAPSYQQHFREGGLSIISLLPLIPAQRSPLWQWLLGYLHGRSLWHPLYSRPLKSTPTNTMGSSCRESTVGSLRSSTAKTAGSSLGTTMAPVVWLIFVILTLLHCPYPSPDVYARLIAPVILLFCGYPFSALCCCRFLTELLGPPEAICIHE